MARLLFMLLAALAGCVGEPSRPPGEVHADSSVASLGVWSMEGRIAVQADGAWQADMVWDHEGGQDRLRLSGPLNQGAISLILQKELIYINEGNGKTELSRDPDATLRRKLGFAVPLSSLRYWVLGMPDPRMAHQTLAKGASLAAFGQSGWTIFLDADGAFAGHTLPRKLRIQSESVRLKIIVDDWTLKTPG